MYGFPNSGLNFYNGLRSTAINSMKVNYVNLQDIMSTYFSDLTTYYPIYLKYS